MDNVEEAVRAAGAAPDSMPAQDEHQVPSYSATAVVNEKAAEAIKPHPHTSTMAENRPSAKALPRAKLQVLSGAFAGKELVLTKALTTLGRPGVHVAAITRRAEGYFVVHVDGGAAGNYPIVNGKPIGPQACRLNDNDVIELASVKMGFFEN